MTAPGFSVLLPVYHGDVPAQLDQAMASVFDAQDLPPAQVVIVRDGPVGPELGQVLAKWAARPEARLVELAHGVGIVGALNAGLAACRHRIVARMDADDVALPHRFAVQVPLVAGGLDIVGGSIEEFERIPGDTGVVRRYPESQADIERFARLHNPFAHPSVVFNADLVRRVGGYKPIDRLEDYLLWAKCLVSGARVANVPQVVLAYRASAATYRRRGGWRLAQNEVRLQRTFRAMGFTTRGQEARNLTLRLAYELSPPAWRRLPVRLALRHPN